MDFIDDVNIDELFEPFDTRLYKCQWKECNEPFDDFGYYIGHNLREHLNDYEDGRTVCGWRGCKQSGFATVEQLYTHITVHIYYYKIMNEGYRLLKDFGFDKAMCYLGSTFRCDISVFPINEYVCAWKDCNGTFSDYNQFVDHVGYHAIEDVTIPLVAKEKLKEIRYAHCEWLKCGKQFKTKSHLKAHLMSHSFGKKYGCPACGLGFANRSQLLNHCHRQKVDTSIAEEYERPGKQGKKRRRDKIEDDEDEDEDEDDDEDEEEEESAEDVEKNDKEDKEDKRAGKEENKEEERKAYPCLICSKCFLSRQLLTQHVALHEKKYACDQCSYIAPYPCNLKTHIKYKHSNQREYKCRFCEAKFKTNNDLVRHVHLHSDQPSTNVCSVCLKTYATRYTLKRHMADHGKAQATMKFQCEVCERKFEDLETITEHIRREHSSG